jgi:hypothetical protein
MSQHSLVKHAPEIDDGTQRNDVARLLTHQFAVRSSSSVSFSLEKTSEAAHAAPDTWNLGPET